MVKFGTGGWRAIIGDGFTKANVQLASRALAEKMKDEGVAGKGFVIGYDRRFLSDLSAEWIGEVFAAQGINCYFIDRPAPTPLVMFTVKYYDCKYGIAVTASHNPAIYNGIKLFTSGGCDADEVVTESLEEYIEKFSGTEIEIMDFKKAVEKGYISIINPNNSYIDSIIRMINMDVIRSKNLKIALDPMFGVSKTSLQTILLTARCDLDVIHERHDALFGGRLPAPTEDTLRALTNFVIENKCNIGVATDGDADRIGVIDDTGEFIHPNKILVLLYYYLQKYKNWKGSVVRNIATTHLLDKIAKSFGEECYEVPVGFKHISSKMTETNALIGGESSGGLTVRGHIKGKDGIYAAVLLTEMIATVNKNISEIYKDITKEYGEYYMIEKDFTFSQERKEEILDTLMVKKELPEFGIEIDRVSYLDGCKVYFKNNGWIVARFSGTEPLIRIFTEMENKEEAEKISVEMESFLGLMVNCK